MASRKVPRKLPQQSRSRATIDAILEATEQLALEHGVESVRPSDIARRAGVALGTLYQYYPGREAILAAWRERSFEKDVEELLLLLTRPDGADASVDADEGPPLRPPSFEEVVRRIVPWAFDRYVRRLSYYQRPNEVDITARVDERERVAQRAVTAISAALAATSDSGRLLVRDYEAAAHVMIKTVGFLGFDAGMCGHSSEMIARIRTETTEMILRYLLKDPRPA